MASLISKRIDPGLGAGWLVVLSDSFLGRNMEEREERTETLL